MNLQLLPDKFYYKYGIRKITDFVAPKVLDLNSVVLPYFSSLHFYNIDKEVIPDKVHCRLLKFVKKADLFFPIEYIEPVYTSYNRKTVNENSFVYKIIKDNSIVDFNVLTSYKLYKDLKLRSQDFKYRTPVVSYNYINEFYRYKPTQFEYYYKYFNSSKTIFKNIMIMDSNIDKKKLHYPMQHYIVYDIPDFLYTKEVYLKYIKEEKPTIKMLKLFYEYEHMFLLDFIRSFFKGLKDKSVFNTLFTDSNRNNLMKNTTLILRDNDKGIFLNLFFVYSLIDELDMVSEENIKTFIEPGSINLAEEDIVKYLETNNKINPKKFFNLFYFMLKLIKKLPAFTPEEIDKGSHIDKVSELLNIDLNSEAASKVESKLIKHLVNNEKDNLIGKIKQVVTNKEEQVKNTNKTNDTKTIEDILNTKNDDIEDILNIEKQKDENDVVENLTYTTKYAKKADIEKIINEQPTVIKETEEMLNELYTNKLLDTSKYNKLNKIMQETLNKKDPFTNKKIKEVMVTKPEELIIDNNLKKLPIKPKVIKNDVEAEDTIKARNIHYFKNIYGKDMIQSIMSIQRAGLIVKDIRVNEHEDILGEYQNIEIDVSDLGKSTYTIKTKIPKVDPKTGTYIISGNRYFLRNQKTDIPIKKIAYNKVSLSSAYGKIFVVKAQHKKNDRGFSIKKELNKLVEDNIVKNLVSGTIKTFSLRLPNDYAEISRYTKSFVYKGLKFNFTFPNRKELLHNDKLDLDKIEQKGKYVLTGITPKKEPIVMDFNNCLFVYSNNKYIPISKVIKVETTSNCATIIDVLNLDKSKIKKEFSSVLIYKQYIPVVLLLMYYMGLEVLLKALKVKYEILDGKKNIKGDNIISIKFKFNTLVIHIDNQLQSMILEGLKYYSKFMSKTDIDIFNNKDSIKAIFKDLGFKLNTITEIELLETLFVDAVTMSILKNLHEPTTFVGLLIRASEMLEDDYYMHPNDMNGFVIKGYERIPQMVYANIVNSIRKKKSEEFFGRSRLTVDPFVPWRLINEDSASVLVDDINPIMTIKQKEDTTYLGWLGRKKESMARQTREFHPSDIGVISESSKDSGDVGITAYMTADPVINSVRGIKENIPVDKMSWANILSTASMLEPFITKDDPKRVTYANIMQSHVVPIKDRKMFPIRTGYETIIPYRSETKYADYAKEDGVVEKVGKNNVKVKYKSGKIDTFTFKDWNSKEESGTSFKHHMAVNVKEKQKVKKGDIIYYDITYFEPDPFEPNVVMYRPGTFIKVAFNETMETHEDATLISERLSKTLMTEYVKSRSIVLDTDVNIKDFKKIGDNVTPNTPLFLLTSKIIGDDKIDKKTLDLMQAFIKDSPKAKYQGTVTKIEVRYNDNKSNMSNSVKKLVEYAEANMINLDTGKKYPGKVDQSYSVNGKSLEEGKIEIKYYLELSERMKTGDKAIIGHQLKTTVTNVNQHPILTESNEEIDMLFSLRGVYARIVNSAFYMGTTATLLNLVGKKAYEMYFGKKK